MGSFFKDLLFDYTGQFQWGVFLLLVLLAVIVALAVMGMVCTIRSAIAIRRFITNNEITSGTVTRYYMRESEGTTTVLPMRCGGGSILFPHHTHGEQRYYIELRCSVKSKQYLLRFAIPEEDYESEAVGSEVDIQSGWCCEGYELIAEQ